MQMHTNPHRPAWYNWARIEKAHPEHVFVPRTRDDLVVIVARARAHGRRVRVFGRKYSFNALVPVDDYLVDISRLRSIRIDKHHRSGPVVHVEAGAPVGAVNDALAAEGLAIPSNVVLTTPLMGGLVATGSHGSGRDHATVSELVVAMEIIDSSGRVWRFSEEETPGDVMNAVRLNLGLFGLIYSITLRVVPMFNVDVCDVTTADPDETLASIKSLVEANEYCDVWWMPFNDTVWLKTWSRVSKRGPRWPRGLRQATTLTGHSMAMEAARLAFGVLHRVPRWTPQACRALYALIPDRRAIERITEANHHRLRIDRFRLRNIEIAFEVDADYQEVRRAWRTAVDLTTVYAAKGKFPLNVNLNVRFNKGGKALLSPVPEGKVACYIEVITSRHADSWLEYSAELGDAWMSLPGAAPHWPKEFMQIPGIVARIRRHYDQRLTRFLDIRERLEVDPGGMFLNPFLDKLFFQPMER